MVTVLTHDPKFDVPLLEVALRLPEVAYVGAMGSRRTHDDRLARLREAGLTEEELGRLSSPIGLDLGARTPEETAISIAAEIIAGRWGGSGAAARHHRRPDPRRDEPVGLIIRTPGMRRAAAALVVLVLAAGCTSRTPDEPERRPEPASPTEVSTRLDQRRPVPEPTEPGTDAEPRSRCPAVHHPLSLPALMREPPSGGQPRILRTEYETDAYTRLRRHLPQRRRSPSPAC